jgi:hypothetical protein
MICFRKVPLTNARAGRPDLPFGPQVAALIIRNHHPDRTVTPAQQPPRLRHRAYALTAPARIR